MAGNRAPSAKVLMPNRLVVSSGSLQRYSASAFVQRVYFMPSPIRIALGTIKLVDWHHVPPDVFIRIAEETGAHRLLMPRHAMAGRVKEARRAWAPRDKWTMRPDHLLDVPSCERITPGRSRLFGK
jgi:hypothetical protein